MKINSQILTRVPEYLIEENTDYNGIEFVNNTPIDELESLEVIKPTTISVTAALLENISKDLVKYNTWVDYKDFNKEFKLEELFSNLGTNFALTQVELLKGFFKFKGTYSDLKYILNTAGYDIEIYEADYFLDNSFIGILNRSKYEGIFDKLLSQGYTEEEFQKCLLSFEVRKVKNSYPYDRISNFPEYVTKIINFSESISGEEFFEKLGYKDYDQNELSMIPSAIEDWFSNRYAKEKDYNCTISMDVTVDMDSPNFDGMGSIKELRSLLESIIVTRLSVCVRLRSITFIFKLTDELNLNLLDIYNYLITITQVDYIYKGKLVVDNQVPYIVDNQLPLLIPGSFASPAYDLYHYDISIDNVELMANKILINNQYPDLIDNANSILIPGIDYYVYDLDLIMTIQKSFIDSLKLPYDKFNTDLKITTTDYVNYNKLVVNNADPLIVNNPNPILLNNHDTLVYDFTEISLDIGWTEALSKVVFVDNEYPQIVDNSVPILVNGRPTGYFVFDDRELNAVLGSLELLNRPKDSVYRMEIDCITTFYDFISNRKVDNKNIQLIDNNNPMLIYGQSIVYDFYHYDISKSLIEELLIDDKVIEKENLNIESSTEDYIDHPIDTIESVELNGDIAVLDYTTDNKVNNQDPQLVFNHDPIKINGESSIYDFNDYDLNTGFLDKLSSIILVDNYDPELIDNQSITKITGRITGYYLFDESNINSSVSVVESINHPKDSSDLLGLTRINSLIDYISDIKLNNKDYQLIDNNNPALITGRSIIYDEFNYSFNSKMMDDYLIYEHSDDILVINRIISQIDKTYPTEDHDYLLESINNFKDSTRKINDHNNELAITRIDIDTLNNTINIIVNNRNPILLGNEIIPKIVGGLLIEDDLTITAIRGNDVWKIN